MSIRGAAFIAGVYEHPERQLPHHSVAQVHAEVAVGALRDAGLTMADVDGYFCSGDAPGLGSLSMVQYLGISPTYMDTTEIGGSSSIAQIGHAACAILAGKCTVALITLGGLPRQGASQRVWMDAPEHPFESTYGLSAVAGYALAARRHMHEYGTTSEQLARVKVAASRHASFNPNAHLRRQLSVEEVLESPMISDPLRRADCCVVTDGGGALVVVGREVARNLDRHCISVLGHAEAPKTIDNGHIDLTYTGARWSAPRAFNEAGVAPGDIDYASVYDSFTITVIETIEDLGFCKKGDGGPFVMDGNIDAPFGKVPINTDGGGLCNNHPSNRGGITKVIEAVRQLRGEAAEELQVPNAELALAHGTGGSLASRMGSATAILSAEDAS